MRFEDGLVALPEGPGLGIEIDPEGLEAHRVADWSLRVMRRSPEDGSVSNF